MKKHLVFFLLSSAVFSLEASQVNFNEISLGTLTTNEGLISNEVTCFIQDDAGFMWIGTTNGLCRYDGYEFKTYKSNYLTPDFFTGNSIKFVSKDSQNRLWIVTTLGLNVFDLYTGKIKKYSLEAIGCAVINTVAVSRDNVAYIGTELGVLRLDEATGTFENIITDAYGVDIRGNYIQSLFIDSKNTLWIGTWHTGFCALNLDENKFYHFPEIVNEKILSVTSFFEDREQNIWLTSWNEDGLIRLKNPLSKPVEARSYPVLYQDIKILTKPNVYGALQDNKNGWIWIATSDGLKVLTDLNNPKSIVSYNNSNTEEFISNEISSIYMDRTGIIWFSMYGMGCRSLNLNKKHFSEYSFYKLESQKGIKTITSIYEDETGLLWLGVKGINLILFNPETEKIYLHSEHPVLKEIQLPANSILSFARQKERNELWLATRYYGLYVVRFSGKNILSIQHIAENELKSPNTNKVIEGANGYIWVATIKGLNYIEKDTEGNYICRSDELIDNTVGVNNINTLWFDGKYTLWVGSQVDGLFKIELNAGGTAQKISQYNTADGKINNNNVISIYRDNKKRLWIGTHGGGLSLYNAGKDKFELISNMASMTDDAIYAIEEDNRGYLWLSTGKGLVSYNPDLAFEKQIRTFSNLNINSFFIGSSCKGKSGELFFGGNNGLLRFSPADFEDNPESPTPVITSIMVNNKPVNNFDKSDGAGLIPPYTQEIKISHKDNSVRIEFASLSFEDPMSKTYAYKLDGIDDEWIFVHAKNRYAVYNNLKKGIYTFSVMSYNEDGYSTNEYATLKIIRLPAPWETVWAYLLYFIITGSLIYFIFRFFINRMNFKRTLEIEQMERIKSEEVHQAKLQFFTNISHELFTPITVLSCSLDDMETQYPQNASLIQIMKLNLNRLMRLLQQILEFRKAETGNLKLKVSENDVVKFIQEICEISFFPLMKTKRIELVIDAELDELTGYFDTDKLDKIMYNLLSNAFKYNRFDGRITVRIEEENIDGRHRFAIIKVKDTGKGIDENKIPHLFKRFYEGDYRKFKTKGTGIGLSLTKDLVTLHNGSIDVFSEVGKGTEFTVKIPIDAASYAEEQIDSAEEINPIAQNAVVNTDVSHEQDGAAKDITVLFVEDNTDLLKVVTGVLNRNFNVVTATNGNEALLALEENGIDILVTDYVMPKMNGIELCKHIKNEVKFSHIPIILLTAKQNTEDKIIGFEAGADVYITKPFELDSLVANIKSLVRNRRNTSAQFQTKDNIQLSQFTYNSVDEDFLNKAIRVVEENIKTSDFNATDFYLAMNMTQPTLYRKIKSITNLSPNEFIRNIKFKLACKLLTERKLNVSETAYELGFVDPGYFSSIFKKEIGMSPSEYVRKYEESL